MPMPVSGLRTIRIRVIAAGIISGIAISVLVNSFVLLIIYNDLIEIPQTLPGIYLYGILFLSPLVALVAIMWATRGIFVTEDDPSMARAFASDFVLYFAMPFLVLYFVTYPLYWLFIL